MSALNLGNPCYCSAHNSWSSLILSEKAKTKTYTTLVVPVFCIGVAKLGP
jgi:hypothetical protein